MLAVETFEVALTVETADGFRRRVEALRQFGCRGGVLDHALAALRLSPPPETAQVLVWGDARPGNIIFSDDCLVAAVIDWELARIGDAAADVGWWLMMDDFAAPEPPAIEKFFARGDPRPGRRLGPLRWALRHRVVRLPGAWSTAPIISRFLASLCQLKERRAAPLLKATAPFA